jgi:lipopolysaccharide/colanic/teichoic acid biosynthesis glycosyltransferase
MHAGQGLLGGCPRPAFAHEAAGGARVAAGDARSHAAARAVPAGAYAEPILTPVALEGIRRGAYLRWGKRVLDVTLGTALLLSVLPLFALVALAVLATSGWPIFYRSPRLGMDGRVFQMWKFRTMVRDADSLPGQWAVTEPALARELQERWKLACDPRVTPLGTFLRRSSLDELPQFINVLRGEMSIVGPRPYLPREVLDPLLAPSITAVRPGLTGPFQTRGRNGLLPIERQKLEATYWRDIRFVRDLGYLVLTARPLLRMDGH